MVCNRQIDFLLLILFREGKGRESMGTEQIFNKKTPQLTHLLYKMGCFKDKIFISIFPQIRIYSRTLMPNVLFSR